MGKRNKLPGGNMIVLSLKMHAHTLLFGAVALFKNTGEEKDIENHPAEGRKQHCFPKKWAAVTRQVNSVTSWLKWKPYCFTNRVRILVFSLSITPTCAESLFASRNTPSTQRSLHSVSVRLTLTCVRWDAEHPSVHLLTLIFPSLSVQFLVLL